MQPKQFIVVLLLTETEIVKVDTAHVIGDEAATLRSNICLFCMKHVLAQTNKTIML